MLRTRHIWSVAILAGIVMLGTPSAAEAGFRLRLEDVTTGQGVLVTDGGVFDTIPGAFGVPGVLIFSGSIGNFTVNVATGTSHPPLGPLPGYHSLIDLNNVSIIFNGGTGTLRLTLVNDGFVGGAPGVLGLSSFLGGTLSGSAGSTVTFQGWANGANAIPINPSDPDQIAGALNPIATPGGSTAAFAGTGVSFGVGAFSASANTAFTSGASYSLFSEALINATGNINISFNHSTATTPEPATILAALGSLPILGVWARRRKAASTTVAV